MQPVTKKELQAAVDRLNRLTGHNLQPYRKVGASFVQNPGTYVLDWAYGGVSLEQQAARGADGLSHGIGGVILHRGSKRDLYERLHSFIRGVETGMGRPRQGWATSGEDQAGTTNQ